VLAKEAAVGLVMGLILGVAGFARVGLSDGIWIGVIVGVTIAGVTIWSATVAAVLPIILRRVGVDPAVVSAPFITTLVDATGLLIYMLIAGLVLSRVL
jgi:magnesium transporter